MSIKCVKNPSALPHNLSKSRRREGFPAQLGSKMELPPAQQAKQHAERLATAKLAQLRADTSDNDAWDAQKSQKMKNSDFCVPPLINIFVSGEFTGFPL